ncbi:MAG: hypothetical protein ACYS19_20360 [Planctomycetota bacterium]|jgi:hypothetical protein
MKPIKRRTFLVSSAATAGALGFAWPSFGQRRNEKTIAAKADPTRKSHRPNRIAVSTYSFWRFKKNLKLPIETCIDEAAQMGFDCAGCLYISVFSRPIRSTDKRTSIIP